MEQFGVFISFYFMVIVLERQSSCKCLVWVGDGWRTTCQYLLRESFGNSASNSPFIDIEQFRNNSITISRARRGKPSEKSYKKQTTHPPEAFSWQTHTGCGLQVAAECVLFVRKHHFILGFPEEEFPSEINQLVLGQITKKTPKPTPPTCP